MATNEVRPAESRSTFEEYRTAVKAAQDFLAEIKAKDPADVSAEDHAKADRLTLAAAEARQMVDHERSTRQLEIVSAARDELGDADEWAKAMGLVASEDQRKPDTYEEIHRIAGEMFAGERASASLTVDLQGAAVAKTLAKQGMSGQDLIRAYQGGFSVGPKGEMVRAAISTTSGLTATPFSTSFYDYMDWVGGLRAAGAMVTPLDKGTNFTFYRSASHSGATGATAEGSAAAETDDGFESYEIDTAMYTGLSYISRQIQEDAGPAGLMGIIDRGIARVVAKKAETAYHAIAIAAPANAGDRSNHPTFTISATNSTLGDPKVSRSQILDVMFGLDAGYLQGLGGSGLTLYTSAATYRHILGLEDGDNRPLYAASPIPGGAGTVEGARVQLSSFFTPVPAAGGSASAEGLAAFVIGSISDFFHIADVGSVRLAMSNEYKFAEQQVTVLGSLRTGGAMQDRRAVGVGAAKIRS